MITAPSSGERGAGAAGICIGLARLSRTGETRGALMGTRLCGPPSWDRGHLALDSRDLTRTRLDGNDGGASKSLVENPR